MMKDLPNDKELAKMNDTYTISEIADQLGVSRQVIHYRLKRSSHKTIRHPERRRIHHKLPSDEELLKLYKTKTVREISEMYSVNRSSVYLRLKKYPDYDPGLHRRKLPPVETIYELLEQGLTQADVARRYSVRQSAVHSKLKKAREQAK